MEDKSIMLKCDCSSEAIEVQRWSDEDQFYFAYWQVGFSRPLCWRERIRWCWNILRNGNPWADSIIVSPSKAKEIADFINQNIK